MLSVTFCGAARTVTGSMYFLEYIQNNGKPFNFCVDAGMFQVGQQVNLFKVNSYLIFDPRKLDAIVLTHAHLDHCGRIPYLIKRGFGGKIYSTEATKEISEIVMRDAAHLATDESDKPDYFFPVKGLRKIEVVDTAEHFSSSSLAEKVSGKDLKKDNFGLYAEEDVDITMGRFKVFNYHQKFQIHENLEVEFFDAGHILGSSYVVITEISSGKKIVFSGDLGNRDKPIIEDPELAKPQKNLTHIFVETTYGDKLHSKESPKKQLREIAFRTLKKQGKLLIPAFSVERAQEIIYFLVELMRENKLPRANIYLDSPMASKVLTVCLEHPELYDKEMQAKISEKAHPLIFNNLKILETSEQSKSLNIYDKPCIIIAGSGMLNGGRILKHLQFNLENPNNTVLIVGYQAAGTLGKKLLEGANEVEIEHRHFKVQAKIDKVNAFSAHADRQILKEWVESLLESNTQDRKEPTVFLMHGEKESSLGFGRELEKFYPKKLNTYWPYFGEKLVLWE